MDFVIGYDLDFFWKAGQAVLHGVSPYTVGGFYSPFSVALLFVPLALLPFAVAYALWTVANLALLWRATDKMGFVRALLFFPVAFDLRQGQLDLLVFLIARRLDWIAAVVSTLRPQLALWILPLCAWHWIREKRLDQFWKSILAAAILYGICTVIQPNWPAEWLHAARLVGEFNQHAASLFGLAMLSPLPQLFTVVIISAIAALAFTILLKGQGIRRYWQLVAAFNPVANAYSLVVLFDQVDLVAILLGFAALPLSMIAHTSAAWALIPLYLLTKDLVGGREGLLKKLTILRSRPTG